MLPLLRADAVGACAGAVEDLGPPRAGPLSFWLQVAVQVCVALRPLGHSFLLQTSAAGCLLGLRACVVHVLFHVAVFRIVVTDPRYYMEALMFQLERGLYVCLGDFVFLADSSGRPALPRGVCRERKRRDAVESG